MIIMCSCFNRSFLVLCLTHILLIFYFADSSIFVPAAAALVGGSNTCNYSTNIDIRLQSCGSIKMQAHHGERSCIIIGPMKDMELGEQARLKRLQRNIIQPLLTEIEENEVSENDREMNYKLQTPYDLGGDHIMNDVIYAIDRADIVIVDATGGNPNVFYELGICHSLGRPTLVVMEDIPETKIEFDVAAYRVFRIALDDESRHTESQDVLRQPLFRAHRDADWSHFENPVVDFFRAPVTYISPAFSLAQGYYLNFVRPVVESMMRKKGRNYLYDIGVAPPEGSKPRKIEDTVLLTNEIRNELKFQILIPEKIRLAKHNYADRFRGHLGWAMVEGDGRHYTCFYRAQTEADTESSGEWHSQHALVDIPTTIRVMEDAVDRRLRHRNTSHDAPEWIEIERQEIDRFVLNLEIVISRHEFNPAFKNIIEIHRYNPDNPDNRLGWLHEILQQG